MANEHRVLDADTPINFRLMARDLTVIALGITAAWAPIIGLLLVLT